MLNGTPVTHYQGVIPLPLLQSSADAPTRKSYKDAVADGDDLIDVYLDDAHRLQRVYVGFLDDGTLLKTSIDFAPSTSPITIAAPDGAVTGDTVDRFITG